MTDQLTALQRQVLAVLAVVEPPWTVTGDAALAGFHLQHRTTCDLDLFWHGLRTWHREPEDCVERLEAAGLRVHALQRTPAFVRLRASDANESVVVDLVAEPVAASLPPESVQIGAVSIRVDSPQEILANKLGALLHRAELRDLVDIRALLAVGCDLHVARQHAAAKDFGFSPVMVAHLLEQFPVDTQGRAERLDAAAITDLRAFAEELSRRIVGDCRP
jgi:hypothetical protein